MERRQETRLAPVERSTEANSDADLVLLQTPDPGDGDEDRKVKTVGRSENSDLGAGKKTSAGTARPPGQSQATHRLNKSQERGRGEPTTRTGKQEFAFLETLCPRFDRIGTRWCRAHLLGTGV